MGPLSFSLILITSLASQTKGAPLAPLLRHGLDACLGLCAVIASGGPAA